MKNVDYDPLHNVSYELNVDDIKYYLSTVNGDMSHTYGNATAIIEKHLKTKFPKNFFKNTNISTRLAIKQRQSIRTILDYKKEKPILGIQPKLNIERTEYNIDYTRRLYGTSIYDLLRPDQHNVKFFKDTEKRIYVDFSVDRASMEFETMMVVSTEYQQYNLSTHIMNNIRLEVPYFLPTTMEMIIPECIIKKVAQDSGIPIRDTNGSVVTFLNYMNNISKIPITYKMQTSKKTHEFFLVVQNDMWIMFNSLNMQDGGNRNGMVSDSFEIGLNIKCEFNYPNCFFFISMNDAPLNDTSGGLLGMEDRVVIEQIFDRTIIPEKLDAKTLCNAVSFETENDRIDEINIKEILDPETIEIVEELKKTDISNIEEFVSILIYNNSGELFTGYIQYKLVEL